MRSNLNKAAIGILFVFVISYVSSCHKLANTLSEKATWARSVVDLSQDTSTAYYSVVLTSDQKSSPLDSGFNTAALATFRDSATSQLVAMGGLSINDLPVTANADNTYEVFYRSQIDNGSALRSSLSTSSFPQAGTDVKISITGSSPADTVTQFVYVPLDMMASTADFPGSSINVQNDLTLHWIPDPANPSGLIIIKVWYVAGLSRAMNDPTLPPDDLTLTYTVADNGSYTISHTDLQAFHANAFIWIFLGRGSQTAATLPVSNKKVYYFATASVTTPALYVQCAANWQNTATPVRCQQSGSQNTGNQEQEQQDISPCSSTYNQTRWVTIGANPTACPICSSGNCTGNNHKCINGVCETGTLDVISRTPSHGNCITKWGYFFSDGTYKLDHTTTTPGGCEF